MTRTQFNHGLFILSCLVIIMTGVQQHMYAQEQETALDSLRWYSDVMNSAENPKHRKKAAELFNSSLRSFLSGDKSFEIQADSLYAANILVSEDKEVRVATAQVIDAERKGQFFGFVQRRGEKPIPLVDGGVQMGEQKYRKLPPHRFLGAVYETIIDHKYKGENMYLLIGAGFLNLKTWRHVVDVLHINDGKAYFGAPLFVDGENTAHRVVQTFMAGSGAAVKYIEKDDRIIMDHLSTVIDPMSGTEKWVPDGTYFGYQRKRGQWLYQDYAQSPDNRPNPETRPPGSFRGSRQ